MAFLSYLATPRDRLYKEHDPDAAWRELQPFLNKPGLPEEKRAVYELGGTIRRTQKQWEQALQLYKKIGDDYQAGYCALMLGDLRTCQTSWMPLLQKRPTHWAMTLYGLVTNQLYQLRVYPSLFQIRNHMESDIANLIQANQVGFLENLLTYVDFLTQLNLESPKFAGRALMHAGWLDRAGTFLMKGQKALPNDPEIYYHLGQWSVAKQHHKEARLMLNQCLLISPTYTPARELLESLPGGG